jgi:hypothetical protein
MCPAGWEKKFFNNKPGCYLLVHESVKWIDAYWQCKQRGGKDAHLISINTPDENTVLFPDSFQFWSSGRREGSGEYTIFSQQCYKVFISKTGGEYTSKE